MNDHLKPSFSLLAELDKAGMDYWVYGGVSVAALVGKLIRKNKDVDVFVREDDFDRTTAFLERECDKYGLRPTYHSPKDASSKPKIELERIADLRELMAVIPVYIKENSVVFRYPDRPEIYPIQILERVERKIADYLFFTPPDQYIKEIFINHIRARPDKKSRPEFIMDAKNILTPNELAELNWKI